MGPFEEEEEGTGVASDVYKVEGEDPATQGPLMRNDPGSVTIPQYRVNKTKQHTHTHTLTIKHTGQFATRRIRSGVAERSDGADWRSG